jgi:hypothetical protein
MSKRFVIVMGVRLVEVLDQEAQLFIIVHIGNSGCGFLAHFLAGDIW